MLTILYNSCLSFFLHTRIISSLNLRILYVYNIHSVRGFSPYFSITLGSLYGNFSSMLSTSVIKDLTISLMLLSKQLASSNLLRNVYTRD